MDEGLFLTKFASKVHIIHRRESFRAIPSLVKKAHDNEKIVFHTDTVVSSVNGSNFVESLNLKNIRDNAESILPVAGVFLYIGLLPNSEMFNGFLELNNNGFIKVDRELMTSVSGVFAAGDVRDTPLRQVITAASDGALAAHSAGKYLEKN